MNSVLTSVILQPSANTYSYQKRKKKKTKKQSTATNNNTTKLIASTTHAFFSLGEYFENKQENAIQN